MVAYRYTQFTSDADDMNSPGSTDPTRPSEGWKGRSVNDSLRATNSALFNLGTEAAKLPLNEDDNLNLGPNAGRIGTLAFQDSDNVQFTGGVLGPGVRGNVPSNILLDWVGTFALLQQVYQDLRLSGYDICDGRSVVNPYAPFNTLLMPNYTGLYKYYYTDFSLISTLQFAHDKTTSSTGTHAHGALTGGHDLTDAEVPALVRVQEGVQSGVGTPVVDSYSYGGAGAPHQHPIGSDGAHTHTVDVRPRSLVCVPLLRVW